MLIFKLHLMHNTMKYLCELTCHYYDGGTDSHYYH